MTEADLSIGSDFACDIEARRPCTASWRVARQSAPVATAVANLDRYRSRVIDILNSVVVGQCRRDGTAEIHFSGQ